MYQRVLVKLEIYLKIKLIISEFNFWKTCFFFLLFLIIIQYIFSERKFKSNSVDMVEASTSAKKLKKDFMVHTLKLNIKIKLCNKRWKTKWRSYVTKEFRLSRELYAKFQSSARIPSKSSQRSKLLNIRIKVHQRQKILKTAMTQRHWACWT
mgnify:CR=1 FL=1